METKKDLEKGTAESEMRRHYERYGYFSIPTETGKTDAIHPANGEPSTPSHAPPGRFTDESK